MVCLDLNFNHECATLSIAQSGQRRKETEMTNLTAIKEFFGFATLGDFRNEWTQLSDKDKNELREGIENGTLTY